MLMRLDYSILFADITKDISQTHCIFVDEITVGCGEYLFLTIFLLFLVVFGLVVVEVAYYCDIVFVAFYFGYGL